MGQEGYEKAVANIMDTVKVRIHRWRRRGTGRDGEGDWGFLPRDPKNLSMYSTILGLI